MSSELHCLLTLTGYGPRLCIVCITGKSAMISEVVCVLQTKKFFDRLRLHQTLYYCGHKEIICIGEVLSSANNETGKVICHEH